MKKWQKVKIYQKPLTEEGFEGNAILLNKEEFNSPTGFEYWNVKFISDGVKAVRLVKIQ